jgi:hypothetical protein
MTRRRSTASSAGDGLGAADHGDAVEPEHDPSRVGALSSGQADEPYDEKNVEARERSFGDARLGQLVVARLLEGLQRLPEERAKVG